MKRKLKRFISFMLAMILVSDSSYSLLSARAEEMIQLQIVDDKETSYDEFSKESETVADISMEQEKSLDDLDYVLGRPMTESEKKREQEEMKGFISNLVPIDPGRVAPRLLRSKEVIVRSTLLPTSYDSRDENIVTPIKNQSPHGICWSFSSTAMAEISMIKQGFHSIGNIDFSEYHLAYYTYRFLEDPLGGTEGDSNYKASINNILNDGGNFSDAANTYTLWMGAAGEEDAPFPAHNNPQLLAETQEHAYGQNEGIIKNVREINLADRDAVKRAIMDYGALGLMYYATEDPNYYNFDTAAQYINQEVGVNHGVVIIGWDDNYSKNNFTTQPVNNGAWLIRNSWGTSFGHEGYFWLSYEDKSMFETVYAFQMTTPESYDHNYQYDASARDASFGYNMKVDGVISPVTTYTGANIFQAKGTTEIGGKEALKAVSFKTLNANLDYEIQIYKNPVIQEGVINPESGEALLTSPITGSTTHAGYYTVDIMEEIILDQGDYFAVAITYTSHDGAVRIVVETSTPSDEIPISTAVSQTGQSVYKVLDTWMDNTSQGYANLRIKAFTSDVVISEPGIPVTDITLDQISGTLKSNESIQLTYNIIPSDATNTEVIWKSNNQEVATVSNTGLVTALGQGTAMITVTTVDGSFQDTYTLLVDNPPVITAVNVSELTDESAVVTIEANDGADGSINTYELELVTNVAGATIVQKAAGNQFEISGLAPQTTYTVRAKVTDNTGNVVSKEKEFTTLIHIHKWGSQWSTNATHHWHACISTDGMSCEATDITKASGYGEHLRGDVQNYKEPTATEFGYTGDIYCIDCNKLLEEGENIDKLVPVTAINILETSGKLTIGSSIQLTYSITPQNATNKEITWESNNQAVAKVSNTGLVTANGQGTAIITVRSEDGGFQDTYILVVDNPPVISAVNISELTDKSAVVTIEANDGADGSISTYELEFLSTIQGGTIKQKTNKSQFEISGLTPQTTYIVRVKVRDNTGSTVSKDVSFTTSGHQHIWDTNWSGNETHHWHACVSDDGMSCEAKLDITKSSGYGEHQRGEVQNYKEPTATEFGYTGDIFCLDCERLLEEGDIIEKIIPVTSVNIVEASGTLRTGNTVQLTYHIAPLNATNKGVTWKSSNTTVAEVSDNGVVTAHEQGEATITVISDDGSFSDTYDVVVNNPPVITAVNISGITDESAIVTIEANDGTDGSIVTYELKFSTGVAGAGITQTASGNQFLVSGLTPQTAYTVVAKVTDNAGTSISREIDFTTLIHEHQWSAEWTSNATHHWHECVSEDGMSCEADDIANANSYGEHRRGEVQNYKEASTTEPGYSGDVYCLDCNMLMVQGTEIPKNEQPGEGSEDKPGEGSEDKPGEGSEDKPGEEDIDYGDILPEDRPIDGKIPDGIWVAGIEDKEYNGKKHIQKFRVYDRNKLLREKTDYTVAQKNNKKAYTYDEYEYQEFLRQYKSTGRAVAVGNINPKKVPQVVLTMKGNYTGKQIICYEIHPVDISSQDHVFCSENILSYQNGKVQPIMPILYWNNTKLKIGRDYRLDGYSGNNTSLASGNYIVGIIGTGNFTGYREIMLTVTGETSVVSMDKVVVNGLDAMDWTGTSLTQPFQVTYKNQVLKEGMDYTVEWRNTEKVGYASVVLTGTGNGDGSNGKFVGEKILFFKVKGVPFNKAIVTASENHFVYTGREVKPEFKVSDSLTGRILEEDIHYTVDYLKNIEKGNATAILTALPESGFTGSKKVTFKIQPAELKLTGNNGFKISLIGSNELLSADDRLEFAYTQGGVKPKFEVLSPENRLLIEGKDYTLSYKNNSKLSSMTGTSASVTIKGKGNYSGQIIYEYNIFQKDVSDNSTVTVYAADKVFSSKKNGWKQKFKILDENKVPLSQKDYDASSAVYSVYSLPEGNNSLKVGDVLTSPDTIVPEGSVIQVSVVLRGEYYKGVAVGYYRILKEGYDISKASIKINKQSYTGREIHITEQEQLVVAGVKMKGSGSMTPLTLGKDIQVIEGSYVRNTVKGTAKVTFRGIGEYGGQKTVTFKITGKSVVDYWMGLYEKILNIL